MLIIFRYVSWGHFFYFFFRSGRSAAQCLSQAWSSQDWFVKALSWEPLSPTPPPPLRGVQGLERAPPSAANPFPTSLFLIRKLYGLRTVPSPSPKRPCLGANSLKDAAVSQKCVTLGLHAPGMSYSVIQLKLSGCSLRILKTKGAEDLALSTNSINNTCATSKCWLRGGGPLYQSVSTT